MSREALQQFVTKLVDADGQSDSLFLELLSTGVEFFSLGYKDIAREFDISFPTATRWISGANAPHPAVRPLVYTWLRQQAEQQLRKVTE